MLINKNIQILLTAILLVFISGCSNQYKPIPPNKMTIEEVRFAGVNGGEVNTKIIYSVPNHYNCKKSSPLIVALHGNGSNADAFHDLWKPVTDDMGFVLLTPQGENMFEDGFGWTWGDNAERSVLTAIEIVCQSINIDREKIYLAGFSAGGRLTYTIGLRHSDLFRGIAALGAHFKEEWLPENRMIINTRKAYIGHGSLETEIAEESEIAVDVLAKIGLQVKYVQYEGIGHGLPEPMEDELRKIIEYISSG